MPTDLNKFKPNPWVCKVGPIRNLFKHEQLGPSNSPKL